MLCWLSKYDNSEDVEVDSKFDCCGEPSYVLHSAGKIAFLYREKQHDCRSFRNRSFIRAIPVISELEFVTSVVNRDCHFGEINERSS